MKNTDILKLYKEKNTVLTFKDISLMWQETSVDLLKRRLNYYVSINKLISLRRGIYAKSQDYDPLELGTKIYTPSYISLETVLQKEGIIFQNYTSIFVVSYLSREIKCDKRKFQYKKFKNEILINLKGLIEKNNYFIASKERAFLDTLYLYKDYYFDNLRKIDWDKCREILPIYENKTLVKRFNRYYKNYAK